MLAPPQGPAKRLWLVCGGNGALALDMEPLCRSLGAQDEAWLMVDYPGYGGCKGEPSADGILRNVKAAVLEALPLLKMAPEKLPDALHVFGHSLGCAAALLAVQEFHTKSVDLSIIPGGHHHDLFTAANRDAYLPHPEHVRVRDIVVPCLESVMVFDFET